jgi:hypothetical protein
VDVGDLTQMPAYHAWSQLAYPQPAQARQDLVVEPVTVAAQGF